MSTRRYFFLSVLCVASSLQAGGRWSSLCDNDKSERHLSRCEAYLPTCNRSTNCISLDTEAFDGEHQVFCPIQTVLNGSPQDNPYDWVFERNSVENGNVFELVERFYEDGNYYQPKYRLKEQWEQMETLEFIAPYHFNLLDNEKQAHCLINLIWENKGRALIVHIPAFKAPLRSKSLEFWWQGKDDCFVTITSVNYVYVGGNRELVIYDEWYEEYDWTISAKKSYSEIAQLVQAGVVQKKELKSAGSRR